MTAKKQKEKDRRRARKLAEQAWEAYSGTNLDLAVKIIRRAVATQPDNPVLWNDQGMLLGFQRNDAEADKSFRTALSLAPDYAEPYAQLAGLRARQGFYRDAVAFQTKAVQYAPQSAEFVDRLDSYRLLETQHGMTPWSPPAETSAPSVASTAQAAFPAIWHEGLAARDWGAIGADLTRTGCALVPQFVDAVICAALANLFDHDALFAKTIVMAQDDFGQGVYRYFRDPIPPVVDELRRDVYPLVAKIANDWQELLGKEDRYPATWDGFREECHRAGQRTPTPILLKYGPRGFNALHRDLRGQVYFPIQLAVVLSPRADPADPQAEGFTGGDFLFCDVPERGKSRRQSIAAGLGDGLLFCTRDRLVRIGGVFGLQPVKHGVDRITRGTRMVLGVPFHEYR